jgi:phenylacetate-CoA ligase
VSLEDRLHPLLSAYVASPQWVKSTIGHAYAAVPDRIKYGAAFKRFRAETRRCYQVDGLSEAVEAKLMETLHCALSEVPAYSAYREILGQRLSPKSLLSHMPLTSKIDIKADLTRYLSPRRRPHEMLEMFTGGSTANPMRFFAHKHFTRPKEAAYFQDFDSRAGLRSGDIILNLRGRSVAGAGQPGGRMWMFEPIRRHLILSSDHMEPRFMPEYVKALRQWRPTAIHAFPSALYPLARWLDAHPEPAVTDRIHGIELTSENTYDYQLALFRRVFHCPVIRGYGHTERVLLAATMPDDDRFFFWPLYGYLELIDSSGREIKEPGILGEIVGTSFDNAVMPFVRYRTGDMGVWSDTPHRSLQGFQVLERIEGRLQDFVVCSDRRLVSITTLGSAHFRDLADVETIQYEQHEAGRLVLKVVCERDLDDRQRAAIATAVRSKTQDGCEVTVVRVASVEQTVLGKTRLLVQHLDVSGFLGSGMDPQLASGRSLDATGGTDERSPAAS